MAIIAVTSVKHSPGVTTTALGIASVWPGSTILVEADPAGGDLRATYYAGRVDAGKGVLELAIAARYGDLTASWWAQLEPMGPERSVLLGIGDITQAAAAAELWEPAARHLRSLADEGITSVIDAGRLGAQHAPRALLAAADLRVLVIGSDLPGIAAARGALQMLRPFGETAVLVVGPNRPHPTKDIEAVLDFPVLATVPWSERNAQALLMNDRPLRPAFRHNLATACEQIGARVQERARLLTPIAISTPEGISHA